MATNASCNTMTDPMATASRASDPFASQSSAPSAALLDFFFPGLSVFTGALQRYLHIDLNYYFPLVLLLGGVTFAWNYFSNYLYTQLETHFMSTVEIRYDDEVYNMLMTWVACQPFAQNARRFIVNTMVGSRSWSVWELQYEERRRNAYDSDDEGNDDSDSDEDAAVDTSPEGLKKKKKQKKALSYTPTFGTYYFWYRGSLLVFRRTQSRDNTVLSSDQRESISVSCFGRNPTVLKHLLLETRRMYMRRDVHKTVIYRGSRSGGKYRVGEPTWMRCMARNPRPLSTVILNEKVKEDLVSDVADYLDPATRRWYANRGIPYRRGYLLYGPPGTGKSSLSVSLAGHFNMNIYIVSLNGVAATEETLAVLFNDLPRRCIVLLEDIDTAGLTHTRESSSGDKNKSGSGSDNDSDTESESDSSDSSEDEDGTKDGSDDKKKKTDSDKDSKDSSSSSKTDKAGRLSLSGLLNILDGVASQEGRILIMTTNHVEKLDKALIRPGRVDMMVKFDRADHDMMEALFRSIFATLEGDSVQMANNSSSRKDVEAKIKSKEEIEEEQAAAAARLSAYAKEFSAAIPELTFSPAELQGFLLKHKRDPAGAVEGAAEWVTTAKAAKDKAEKRSLRKKEKAKAREERKKEKEKAKKEKKAADKAATKAKKEAKEVKEKEAAKKKAAKKLLKKPVDDDLDAAALSDLNGSDSDVDAQNTGGDEDSDVDVNDYSSDNDSEAEKKRQKKKEKLKFQQRKRRQQQRQRSESKSRTASIAPTSDSASLPAMITPSSSSASAATLTAPSVSIADPPVSSASSAADLSDRSGTSSYASSKATTVDSNSSDVDVADVTKKTQKKAKRPVEAAELVEIFEA